MDNARNQVVGHLEYRADLFEPSTASRIVKHLEVPILANMLPSCKCVLRGIELKECSDH